MSRFFFEQRGRVLAELSRAKAGIREETSAFERIREDSRGSDRIFDLSAENSKLLEMMKPLLLADFESAAREVCPEYRDDPSATEKFLSACAERLAAINQVTHDALETSLRESEAGEAPIGERVKRIYQEAADHRARSIAEAETENALKAGREAFGRKQQ